MSKKLRASLLLAIGCFFLAAMAPSGAHLQTVKPVLLWERKPPQGLGGLGGAEIIGFTLAFSPDGQLLAVAKINGVVLLRAHDGKEERSLWWQSGFGSIPSSIVFTLDGQYVLAGPKGDGSVKMWRFRMGRWSSRCQG
jgi:WD40 repeat protein